MRKILSLPRRYFSLSNFLDLNLGEKELEGFFMELGCEFDILRFISIFIMWLCG